jgi:quinol monooxygenase YgiN
MPKVTFIARMTVLPGREQEFMGYCKELEDFVHKQEPDVLIYQFFRLREPNRYAVLESFPDEATEERHMSSARLALIGPKLSACLEGGWVREYFDTF